MYDFPNSPTLNQVFGNYTWDGQKWMQTPGLIAATALPLMDGTPAAVGVGNRYAREDHIHPVDTAAVRTEQAQTLTSPQQTQARANVSAFGSVNIQKFTASGTYTPSPGMLFCIIEGVGGGGGGGSITGTGSFTLGGGGGGSGAYSRARRSQAQIGASQPVTIGAGGMAGSGAGGTTSVGSIITATGGGGGGNSGQGGAAGVEGTGDVTAPGTGGAVGTYLTPQQPLGFSGGGAPSVFGGGGCSVSAVNVAAAVGLVGARGGGASGGVANNVTTSASVGGVGGNGLVVITEYCSA